MPGLRVTATASTTPHGGTVTAEGYSRSMAADEAARLTTDAACAIDEGQEAGQHRSSAARDAFTYRFSILNDDGTGALLIANDDVSSPPALDRLVTWAREEIARIGSRRT
jgi:hypothetical protein